MIYWKWEYFWMGKWWTGSIGARELKIGCGNEFRGGERCHFIGPRWWGGSRLAFNLRRVWSFYGAGYKVEMREGRRRDGRFKWEEEGTTQQRTACPGRVSMGDGHGWVEWRLLLFDGASEWRRKTAFGIWARPKGRIEVGPAAGK